VAIVATSAVLLTPGFASGAAKRHAPVRMPDLIGRTRVQTYRIMRNDGLYFVTHGPGSSNDHWAAVAAQSPRPGVEIAWHGEASLTVSTISPTGPRPVPDLINKTRTEVYAAMRAADLYFKTVGPGSTNATWRWAVAQSPAPGTRVRWHAEVTLRVVRVRTRPKAPVKKKQSPVVATGVVVSGDGYKIGVATWYDYTPGQCASPFLPRGTTVTVHDLDTGKAITCVITDRENAGGDRLIDLSETQFAELEPLWRGVINVKVTW
jgi:hypothetical protein